jgi:hypothetical protein
MERVSALPPLAYEEWNATRMTLRLFIQIVGKIRLALAPPRNHWWHVVLYVTPRGLTTGLMPSGAGAFAIDFDFVDHELVVRLEDGRVESVPLRDGLSVAAFHEQIFALLARLGIDVEILAQSYGDPTPVSFADDVTDASYDADSVERFWRILSWNAIVLEEFAGWFNGKTSPVHLFWHSLDLAVTRFSGKRAPNPPTSSFVSHEAYTHEVISFGFWAGDDSTPTPTFYSYTYPEPAGLAEQPLQPAAARWVDLGSSHQARIAYEDVRTARSPREALLAFLQSAYEAGARTANWPLEELASTWAPRAGAA